MRPKTNLADLALADLARQINARHTTVKSSLGRALAAAMVAGDLLIQAKNKVRHGQWLRWLAAHVSIPERTAQNYMRLAENRAAIEAKSADSADLLIDDAIKLIPSKEPHFGHVNTSPENDESAVRNDLRLQHTAENSAQSEGRATENQRLKINGDDDVDPTPVITAGEFAAILSRRMVKDALRALNDLEFGPRHAEIARDTAQAILEADQRLREKYEAGLDFAGQVLIQLKYLQSRPKRAALSVVATEACSQSAD